MAFATESQLKAVLETLTAATQGNEWEGAEKQQQQAPAAKAKAGGKKAPPKSPTSPKTPVSPTSPLSPVTPSTPMTPTSLQDREAAAQALAEIIKADGVEHLPPVVDALRNALASSSSMARYGALLGSKSLVTVVGHPAVPFLMGMLPLTVERMGDKVGNVRQAASDAAKALIALVCPWATRLFLPALVLGMGQSQPWQAKKGALALLAALPANQLKIGLPEIIPAISECMWDMKTEIKSAATSVMNTACLAVGNPDIEPFIPTLIQAILAPEQIPECVYKLAATTFVQAVDSAALAVLVPLLIRGLKERATPIKRQCAVIIDNMAKLVDEPHNAIPFLERLVPGLENIVDVVSDPECRQMATKTLATVAKIREAAQKNPDLRDEKWMKTTLSTIVPADSKIPEVVVDFLARQFAEMAAVRCSEEDEWEKCIIPYVQPFVGADKAKAIARDAYHKCSLAGDEEEEDDENENERLCKCEFSLAYGAKTLLNCAKLHLKRGRRYGLCGGNDSGKSTLMRAIAGGQLEGFPSPDELRSVYVEPDIPALLADLVVIEFVFADPKLAHVSREDANAALESVGFTPEMRSAPVTSLSGGWRMKLALARAMLSKAEILMLDEPTNHLDKYNVAWLQNYLVGLSNVTSITVSHDSSFLDTVCTDIIHIENKKLKQYRGNLSEFVKHKPEAKSYYELKSSRLTFKFPEPGYLEGVKSKSKVILKMVNVGFTYPGTTRKIISGVTIWCSLSSRVAVLGVNGAGKSTMIKILTGELIPDEGEIIKHPNMRFAYVAQHAFHHLEDHLEKTPNEYLQWRFAGGEDKEANQKAAKQLTPEEEKKMAEKITIDGEKRQIEKLLGRRQLKKSYEYEVKWVGKPHTDNSWLPKSKLDELGWAKITARIDEKEAAQQAAYNRPLTQHGIVKHLEDVGLEEEFTVHTQIRALSGGQKVKVVIAAAMWSNPHILVLDEPTNYLDRDSLGALAGAITEFGGGVLMISHHHEFTDALCTETWIVADGKVVPQNQPAEFAAGAEKIDWKPEEESVDASGNVVKVTTKKTNLSRKERLAREKNRKARKDRGEEVSEDEEDL